MEEITKSVVRRYIKAVVFVICFFAVFFLVFSFGLLLSQQQTMEEPDYEIVISNRGEERQTPSSAPPVSVGEDGTQAAALSPLAPVPGIDGAQYGPAEEPPTQK